MLITHLWYSKCRSNGEVDGCNCSIGKSCVKQIRECTDIYELFGNQKSSKDTLRRKQETLSFQKEFILPLV